MKKKIFYIIGAIVSLLFIIGLIAPTPENKITKESTETTNITTSEIISTSSPETYPTKNSVSQTAQQTKTVLEQKLTVSQHSYYNVTQVVDGDTIKINKDGQEITLRLIGMDTPETVDPRKPVQCFGKEASNKAKELLSGKKVRIEMDVSQGELDKYGRTLAYVYRDDGMFYNKYMIEQGYAHEYTYNTPYKYQTEFKTAQKTAQASQLGLWSPNTCNGDTTSSNATTQTAPAPTSSGGKYYTSSYYTSQYYYPEACDGWKSLSTKYLKAYDSLEALLSAYPSKTLSPQCSGM